MQNNPKPQMNQSAIKLSTGGQFSMPINQQSRFKTCSQHNPQTLNSLQNDNNNTFNSNFKTSVPSTPDKTNQFNRNPQNNTNFFSIHQQNQNLQVPNQNTANFLFQQKSVPNFEVYQPNTNNFNKDFVNQQQNFGQKQSANFNFQQKQDFKQSQNSDSKTQNVTNLNFPKPEQGPQRAPKPNFQSFNQIPQQFNLNQNQFMSSTFVQPQQQNMNQQQRVQTLVPQQTRQGAIIQANNLQIPSSNNSSFTQNNKDKTYQNTQGQKFDQIQQISQQWKEGNSEKNQPNQLTQIKQQQNEDNLLNAKTKNEDNDGLNKKQYEKLNTKQQSNLEQQNQVSSNDNKNIINQQTNNLQSAQSSQTLSSNSIEEQGFQDIMQTVAMNCFRCNLNYTSQMKFISFPCHHNFHQQCIAEYLTNQIKSQNHLYLSCQCGKSLSYKIVSQVIGYDTSIQKELDDKIFQIILQQLQRKGILENVSSLEEYKQFLMIRMIL